MALLAIGTFNVRCGTLSCKKDISERVTLRGGGGGTIHLRRLRVVSDMVVGWGGKKK